MDYLAELDWNVVRAHYDQRAQLHHRLARMVERDDRTDLVSLLLGITDGHANYSASEHGLGPQIMGNNLNAERRIYELAVKLMRAKTGRDVPPLIREAAIKFLKIGVGSEASMMLNPENCWVTNARSIWAHLLVKHADNRARATEELRYYRDGLESEMDYVLWSEIHLEMDTALTRIAERSSRLAREAGIVPGPLKYMWADAVSNALYTDFCE